MTLPREICVADDDPAVGDSLDFLLGSAGFRVHLYASGEALLQNFPAECACVLVDVRMPGMDGLTVLRTLKERACAAPVIIMTGHGDVPLAVTAMKDGAADFLQKPFSDRDLLDAVNAAIRAASGSEACGAGEAADIGARLAQLSPRERQVLERLIAGDANKVIAHDLGLSPRTVEVYRANVMSKMDAGSFAELVRLAVRGGVAP